MSAPPLARVVLRKDIGAAVRAGHPWIYRDACGTISTAAGQLVEVVDREGKFVASGFADEGPIGVRVLSTLRGEPPLAVATERLKRAIAMRARFVDADTNAYRLVHGEGDGVPGVVVDRYDRIAMLKFDGPPAERALHDLVVRVLGELLPELTLLVRRGRGENKTTTAVTGAVPDGPVMVKEHGMTLLADLREGQKTGLFLDHREGRHRVRGLAANARVLNLYGYVGGFSVAAGLGGARHVETVDVAKGAVALAAQAWAANGLDPARHVATVSDVPVRVEQLRTRSERFDLVIADPPSFAPSQSAVAAAVHAYRKLHASCLRLLVPGGLYLAASCSSHVDAAMFDRTLREASERTGSRLQILDRWGAPPDHPRLSAFPEGEYLKCVLARLPE